MRKRDREVTLTAREYALLEFLALHADEVIGRAIIAEHVWDASYDPLSNVIDVCVQRLRRKLDEKQGAQVRATTEQPVPEEYRNAVAEYYRRLSREK